MLIVVGVDVVGVPVVGVKGGVVWVVVSGVKEEVLLLLSVDQGRVLLRDDVTKVLGAVVGGTDEL